MKKLLKTAKNSKTMNLAKKIFKVSNLMIILMTISFAIAMPSCKSKKKVTPKKETPKIDPQVTSAKSTLNELLNDENKSIEELEQELAKIKAMNLNDSGVQALISRLEEKINSKKEAAKEQTKKEYSLAEYFDLIAQAQSANDANQKIQEALKLCANSDIPVLIIIAEEDGETDYDEPTTALKYLNYLKDVKKNTNKIKNLKFDSSKKITEIELIKK